MIVNCPHCKKEIDLIGAGDLRGEYGIGPNSVAHFREKGLFPEPWMTFNNRHVWLRSSVDGYVTERSRAKLDSNVAELMSALENLPERERKLAKSMIEKRLEEETKAG